MHELWICRSILEIIKEQAFKKKCNKVKMVCLEVWQLAMIDKSYLLFSFDVVTKGTIAENAVVSFIDIISMEDLMMSLRDVVIFFAGAQFFHTISHIILPFFVSLPLDMKLMVFTSTFNVWAIVINGVITLLLLWWAAKLTKK